MQESTLATTVLVRLDLVRLDLMRLDMVRLDLVLVRLDLVVLLRVLIWRGAECPTRGILRTATPKLPKVDVRPRATPRGRTRRA